MRGRELLERVLQGQGIGDEEGRKSGVYRGGPAPSEALKLHAHLPAHGSSSSAIQIP